MRRAVLAAALAATLWQVPARAGHYITVDVGGDGATELLGINAKGEAVGYANDGGFIRERDGSIVLWQIPGYTLALAAGINSRGDIAGSAVYSCSTFNCSIGFLRLADGNAVTFFASGTPGDGTAVLALNDKDQTAGDFADSGGGSKGFVRDRDGKVRTVNITGAQSVVMTALNDGGYAAGYFYDTAVHGLLVAPDGSQTVFDVPGALSTYVTGLSEDGSIVGYYDDGFTQTAYLRKPDGTMTAIAVPGATMSQATAIDRFDDVTGYYTPKGHYRAFLLRPSGEIVTFRAKGAIGTESAALNDHAAVAGGYEVRTGNDSWKNYGFIWRP